MKTLAEIKARAQSYLPANYTISDAKSYEWANDAQAEFGSGASVLDFAIYVATEDAQYRLPTDFISVTVVNDSDGDAYTAYTLENGAIAFDDSDTYEVWYRRLPGPIAHKTDDTATVTTADADDEDTLVALANALKAAYNTHRASTTYHAAADTTNTVSSSDATDEASAITLINEIKADLNAHRSQTGVHLTTDSHNQTVLANATDEDTAYALVNEIKRRYNGHIVSGLVHEALHRAIALYMAYQYRVTEKPDSNHATILYAQFLNASTDGGMTMTTYNTGGKRIKGWW